MLKKKLLNDDNLAILIKANCLLKEGKTRHFGLDVFFKYSRN